MTNNFWIDYFNTYKPCASVKIDRRSMKNGGHTYGIGKMLEVYDDSALVQIKKHSKPEIIDLNFLKPWKKGIEMQCSVIDPQKNKTKETDKMTDKSGLKEYVIMVQNEKGTSIYTEKGKFSVKIEEAKIYSNKANAGRARGQVARKKFKPGEPFITTIFEAKQIMKSYLSNNPESAPKTLSEVEMPNQAQAEKQPVKEPNKEDDVYESLILESIVEQGQKIKELMEEDSKLDKEIEEYQNEIAKCQERKKEIKEERKKLSEQFKPVCDLG